MLHRVVMNEFDDIDVTILWKRGYLMYPYTLIPIKYLVVEEFYV